MTEYAKNQVSGDSFAGAVSFDQRNQLDTLAVATPEQVDLRFPVSGIGSRFLAHLLDVVLITAAYLLFFLLMYVTNAGKAGVEAIDHQSTRAQNWWTAGVIIVNFLFTWGYFVLFEAFWHGQTPGKRVMKIRVIKDSGRAMTLFESMARNLLRVIDTLPGFYLVGVITMLCNRSSKRVGDLAAGTLVVHERLEEQPLLTHNSRTFTASLYPEEQMRVPTNAARAAQDQTLPADAVARLKNDDLHLVETFFSRALDLTVERRAELAARVSATVCSRMGFVRPETMGPEQLLETVSYRMRAQGRF